MGLASAVFEEKSRFKSLPDHFSLIGYPRDVWRVAHPLLEVLLNGIRIAVGVCNNTRPYRDPFPFPRFPFPRGDRAAFLI